MSETFMLSRVADSLYWLSRYLERAEHISRLVDVHLNLMLDSEPGVVEQKRLATLLDSFVIPHENTELDINEWVRRLTFDPDTAVSIISAITEARENARQVREQISSEMWTQINTLYLQVRRANQDTSWEQSPHEFYKGIRNGSHLFQGITDATMNHHQGWRFIQLGRYIERIYGLLNLLNAHYTGIDPHHQSNLTTNHFFELLGVLKSVTAFEAYCKVYNPNLQSAQIIEFLLFNQAFPRSLRFCVDMSLESLTALADSTNRAKNSPLLRAAGRLQSRLSYDEISDIHYLPDYLSGIRQQVDQIHELLYATYITYQIEDALLCTMLSPTSRHINTATTFQITSWKFGCIHAPTSIRRVCASISKSAHTSKRSPIKTISITPFTFSTCHRHISTSPLSQRRLLMSAHAPIFQRRYR